MKPVENIEQLSERKKNPFDHIYYEFLNYICNYWTRKGMFCVGSRKSFKKVIKIFQKDRNFRNYFSNLVNDNTFLNLRNTVDFFKGNKKDDDMIATDFIGKTTFDSISNDDRKIINKLVEHLTESRYEDMVYYFDPDENNSSIIENMLDNTYEICSKNIIEFIEKLETNLNEDKLDYYNVYKDDFLKLKRFIKQRETYRSDIIKSSSIMSKEGLQLNDDE